MLFVVEFSPVCNFGKLINCELGTVSFRVGGTNQSSKLFVSRVPESGIEPLFTPHGTLYKTTGMKPKYTGYIPRK